MKCPNCSAEGEDQAAECLGCGVVFEKWRRKQEQAQARVAEPAAVQAVPAAESEVATFSLPLTPLAAAGVLVVLVVFSLSAPSGRGVAPSAAALPGGFSLRAPDGWQFKAEECAEDKPCVVVFSRNAPDPAEGAAEAEGGLPAALSAMIYPSGPRVLPKSEDALEGAYLADWRGEVDKYTPGARRWSEADGLKTWRAEASGPKHIREEIRKPLILKEAQAVAELRKRNPTASVITYKAQFSGKKGDLVPDVVVDPGEYRDAQYDVALQAFLVSGRSHTLRFSCRTQESRKAQCAALLEELARGLHVTDRPRHLDLWLASPVKAVP